jgi:hypothetical protein
LSDGELQPRREVQSVIEGINVVVQVSILFLQLLLNFSSFSARACQSFADEYDVVTVLALLAGYRMMTIFFLCVMGSYWKS